MAKGITIVEQKERQPVPDSRWAVNGIEEIFSRDDGGNPVFRPVGNMVKLFARLRTVSGETGPAMSLTAAEYVALVHAFGGTQYAPTPANHTFPAVLLEGQKYANTGGKTLYVESKGGWVDARKVRELRPPEGLYTVKYTGHYSPDDPTGYAFSAGKFDDNRGYLILKFEIVGDSNGKPTVWNGFGISLFLNNVFVDALDENGVVYNAHELGHPVGLPKPDRTRWDAFGKYFADDAWEMHDWQVDPVKSEYGVCEVEMPQVVLLKRAEKAQTPVKVWWEKKQKNDNYWFDLAEIKKYNGDPETVRSATQQEVADYILGKNWVKDDETPFDSSMLLESVDPITFTEEGREWAKVYLAGPLGFWAQAGLDPNNKQFSALTPEQLGKLLAAMEKRFG